MIKIQHIFLIVFGRFWSSSWSLLGGQNRPKMGQVGLKTALETLFFEKREFSRKHLKTNEKSTFLTPRGDPKRPKIAPRRHQDGLKELLFRCQNLFSILIRFGLRLGRFGGRLLGAKLAPKSDKKSTKNRPVPPDRPKTA